MTVHLPIPLPLPLQFKHTTITSLTTGPRLVVLGAVHGNEVCGPLAIQKVLAAFDQNQIQLQQGSVTFVPITNPKAFNQNTRNGDRNLNRNLTPTQTPLGFEDHIANYLCPLLSAHDVLLDLHSFQQGSEPFALYGPLNNQGELQPFALQEAERSLALALGVRRYLDGWLETYAKGVKARKLWIHQKMQDASFVSEHGHAHGLLNLAIDARYGMGTTEWMRANGGYAVTLECGQHEDPNAQQVGFEAIVRTMLHLRMMRAADAHELGVALAAPVKNLQCLSLKQVIDKHHPDDAFTKPWQSFDAIKQGELIGVRHDGTQVLAPMDGFIVFPNAKAGLAQEWFYVATVSDVV